jgi:hypothetical protein
MYLLRKLGIPLAAILVLSVLALITVVLLYENNGLQLPDFKRPQSDLPDTGVPVQTAEDTSLDLECYFIKPTGGFFYE